VKSCVKFNGDQTVQWSSSWFSDSACASAVQAATATTVLAGMGVQPTWLGVDRFKFWNVQETVIAHDTSKLQSACNCNGAFAADQAYSVTNGQCAGKSCPYFTATYALGVLNTTGLYFSQQSATASTAWGYNSLPAFYAPDTSSSTCDYVASWSPLPVSSTGLNGAGHTASLSAVTVAAAILVAVFVTRQ
jgi:hypothetical protein